MNYTVQFRNEVSSDVESASQWYESQRNDMGHRFLDELLSTLQIISENPLMYPIVHRNTHRA